MDNKNAQQYKKMTETPILPLLVKLSVPTVISMLVTNIYNLADTRFVGELGNSASGAVGIVFGYMAIIQAMGFMFGQGSGSIISRYLGAKNTDDASKTASTGFFAALLSGAVIALLSFLFLDSLVRLLGSTETIVPYAKTYISYILIAAPFMTASFVLNNILRYEGKAALGMVGLLTGAILNIAGDPLFMFVCKMGIAGAGLSTALSQIISFFVLLSMFMRGKTAVRLSMAMVCLKPALLFEIMATGMPSLLRQGLNSLAAVLLNQRAGIYGDEAIAAMSIVSRIGFFVFSVALGIGQGFQPISGFNYGAKKYARVRKAFRITFVLAEGAMAVMAAAVFFNSNWIVGEFRNDPLVISIGIRALRLHMAALLFLPLCMLTEMLFQSTGHKFGASLLSSLRSGLFFIPALVILADIRGLSGIEEAQPLAYLLGFIPSVIMMLWFFKRMPPNDLDIKEG